MVRKFSTSHYWARHKYQRPIAISCTTHARARTQLDPKDPSERLFEAACRGCAKGIVTHFAAGANMKWIDQRWVIHPHIAGDMCM